MNNISNHKLEPTIPCLIGLTVVAGMLLSTNSEYTKATNLTTTATVSVASACTMGNYLEENHGTSLQVGSSEEGIGSTRLTVICNDPEGFAIYAAGYSNNSLGNTSLIGLNSGRTIQTGTGTSDVSSWSMRLTKDYESYDPVGLTIENNYDSYSEIPEGHLKVASYAANTDSIVGQSVRASYAVNISTHQAADTYVGQVKYVMVHPSTATPAVEKQYMQDISLKQTIFSILPRTGDSAYFYDRRDGERYKITNINGRFWMTENLRITGTVSGEDSNFVASSFNISAEDLTMGNSNYTARTHIGVDDNGDPTVWYNYVAASAGTVTGYSNYNKATEDICPLGWRLPTHAEQVDVLNYVDLYNPVQGGYYYGGNWDSYAGAWFASEATTYGQRYMIVYNGSSFTSGEKWRDSSAYVRCVFDIDATMYMQEQTSETLTAQSSTLIDKRDGKAYAVIKIGDDFWMDENLRITGIIYADDSNFESGTFNVSAGDLEDGNSNYEARTHVGIDNNGDPTVWYNYVAASAGTITGDNNTNLATEDICPKGWSLPNSTQIHNLLKDTRNFFPTTGGRYSDGELSEEYLNLGRWWSATAAEDSAHRYALEYNDVDGFKIANWIPRYQGSYIRCVFAP